MPAQPATPTIGRPRDARIDEAVLEATRDLLVEVGYQRLSYELVASRAGVGRTAIYRRWPSKPHLVHAAVFPRPSAVELADTGDFAADLRAQAVRVLRSYSRPEARAALPGLLVDLQGDEALRHDVIDSLHDRVREVLADRVAAAVARGELRAHADADTILDVVAGAIFQHVVARAGDGGEAYVERLVDLVLHGLA